MAGAVVDAASFYFSLLLLSFRVCRDGCARSSQSLKRRRRRSRRRRRLDDGTRLSWMSGYHFSDGCWSALKDGGCRGRRGLFLLLSSPSLLPRLPRCVPSIVAE